MAAAALGGLLAGLVSLAVGGYGGVRTLQRALAMLADRVEDLDTRITREVKTRAATLAVEAKRGKDDMVEQLVHLARHPVEPVNDTPKNPAQVLAAARRQGLIR